MTLPAWKVCLASWEGGREGGREEGREGEGGKGGREEGGGASNTCIPLSLLKYPERDWTRQMKARFEELCDQKVKVVEERNEVVMQTEEERIRSVIQD